MKLRINRDSVCLGDDIDNHSKIYSLDNNATYEDLFNVLKKDRYLPSISGNNAVWVLTTKSCDCIFSYFTRTSKFSMGLSEKHLKNICVSSCEVYLKYYSTPEKWKMEIQSLYNGDTYTMWRDGWLDELKYCDYVMAIGSES